jgi:hypothetical protein
MLIELWERLRGIDQWTETTATVSSVNRYSAPKSGDLAGITFTYKDGQGEYQSGSYTVDSLTSLYNIERDDTFSIRYNPAKPSEYFSSEYAATANARLRYILFFGVFILLMVLSWILRR